MTTCGKWKMCFPAVPLTCEDCVDNMVGLSQPITFSSNPVHEWSPSVGLSNKILNGPAITTIPNFSTVTLDSAVPSLTNGAMLRDSNHTLQDLIITGTQAELTVVKKSDESLVGYRSIAYIAYNFSCYCSAGNIGIWSGATLSIAPMVSGQYSTSGSPPAVSTWQPQYGSRIEYFGLYTYGDCSDSIGPYTGIPATTASSTLWSTVGTMNFTPSDAS